MNHNIRPQLSTCKHIDGQSKSETYACVNPASCLKSQPVVSAQLGCENKEEKPTVKKKEESEKSDNKTLYSA